MRRVFLVINLMEKIKIKNNDCLLDRVRNTETHFYVRYFIGINQGKSVRPKTTTVLKTFTN